ncbi:hypothetical protein [Sphingosinicella sp. CPCC 101087]|uniref:hypothetical protein n=1 Tax=Sphingosinicella sp. CPCC 101087 TaxID=2497754 RepID=UPI00101B9AEB|nr:hypothetical protein [Sphingosinicella sp. CPCC 101087]
MRAFLRFSLAVGMLLAVLLLILGALALSRAPAVPMTPTPSPQELAAGGRALVALKAARLTGRGEVEVGQAGLRGLAAITSRTTGVERLRFALHPDRVAIEASHELGAGFWANGRLSAFPAGADPPPIRLSVGRLTLPARATPAAMRAARWALGIDPADGPPVEHIVRSLSIDEGRVAADLRLPTGSGGMARALAGLRSGSIDTGGVRGAYCRLGELQRRDPQSSLAVQVRRAFRGADGEAVADSRAAFVALAMMTVDPEVGGLAGLAPDAVADCAAGGPEIRLARRADLAKHWALSAALAALFGDGAARLAGIWKEKADSGSGGSGFSFVDLAADRSGLLAARRARQPRTAASAAAFLASATEATLLPTPLRALPEGLAERDFAARFGSEQDPRFRSIVRTIDAELEQSWQSVGGTGAATP